MLRDEPLSSASAQTLEASAIVPSLLRRDLPHHTAMKIISGPWQWHTRSKDAEQICCYVPVGMEMVRI